MNHVLKTKKQADRLTKLLEDYGLTNQQIENVFFTLQNDSLKPHGDLELSDTFCLSDGRVSLYPFGLKELYSEEYLSWMNDKEITHTIGRQDYLMPVSREKLVDYYFSIDWKSTVFLAIYSEKEFVGTLKIYGINPLTKIAGIGIAVGNRKYWGRGIATSAIKLACEYIFNVLGMQKIEAGYYATNTGMEKAFLKNGFKEEALLRKNQFSQGKLIDHKLVGRLKEE